MNIIELKEKITAGELDAKLTGLYGADALEKQKSRYIGACACKSDEPKSDAASRRLLSILLIEL